MWQPWASLVVLGAKRIETRNRLAPQTIIGERIAIHATLTEDHLLLARTEPFRRALWGRRLPLGALIGTVLVVSSNAMTEESIRWLADTEPDEYAFGHYAVGRFEWVLADPEPLPEPVPWRGSRGIFLVPSELVGLTARQGALI